MRLESIVEIIEKEEKIDVFTVGIPGEESQAEVATELYDLGYDFNIMRFYDIDDTRTTPDGLFLNNWIEGLGGVDRPKLGSKDRYALIVDPTVYFEMLIGESDKRYNEETTSLAQANHYLIEKGYDSEKIFFYVGPGIVLINFDHYCLHCLKDPKAIGEWYFPKDKSHENKWHRMKESVDDFCPSLHPALNPPNNKPETVTPETDRQADRIAQKYNP